MVAVKHSYLVDEDLVVLVVAAVALSQVVEATNGFVSGDEDELRRFEAGNCRTNLVD